METRAARTSPIAPGAVQAIKHNPSWQADRVPLLLRGGAVRPRADVSFHALDGHAALFDPVRQLVFALDEAEAMAWCILGAATSLQDAAEDLGRRANSSSDAALSWLESAVVRWSEAGLIGDPLAAEPERKLEGRQFRRLAFVPDCSIRRSYHLLDTVIEVGFASREDAALADAALDGLQSDKSSELGCVLIRCGEGWAIVTADGRILESLSKREHCIPALRAVLVELALDHAAGCAAIHAAAVARGDRAVLLPGRSGAGKSTLAAGCILNGWEIVADDTVVLDGAGRLRPLPLPLSLKREVWTLLQRAGADIESAAWHERADGRHVRYLAAPRRALRPCTLAAIIAPQWRRGAAPCVRRLETRAAFEAVLPQYYPLAKPLTRATISEVVALVERIPCFALTYDAVADGTELLERTFAQ